MRDEVTQEGMKLAPPVGVVGATVAGLNFQDWVYAVTFVYVLAQLAYLLWKWRREWKGRKRGH